MLRVTSQVALGTSAHWSRMLESDGKRCVYVNGVVGLHEATCGGERALHDDGNAHGLD